MVRGEIVMGVQGTSSQNHGYIKDLVFPKENVGFCVETLAQWNKVERSGMKWEIGATRKSCWDSPGW
jgi:hypothetical protein